MPAGTAISIGREIIPELGGFIGGLFGGSRDEKREARQQYRDALKSLGVRHSLVQEWHSDEFEAGATLLQIAQQPKGVEFLNKNLNFRITRNSVSNLPSRYQSWYGRNHQTGSVAGGGSSSSGFNVNSIAPLLGIGGLIFWFLK